MGGDKKDGEKREGGVSDSLHPLSLSLSPDLLKHTDDLHSDSQTLQKAVESLKTVMT